MTGGCESGEAECLQEGGGPPTPQPAKCDSCEFLIPDGEEYTLDGDTLCQPCYEVESACRVTNIGDSNVQTID